MHGYFAAVCAAVCAFATAHGASAQAIKPVDGAKIDAACGGNVTDAQYARMPKAKRDERLACMTRVTAAAMTKSLPSKMDDETTLERVEADGMRLIYRYRVTFLKAVVPPDAMKTFITGVRKDVCSSSMRTIIAAGGSYQFFWVDRAGTPLGDLLVGAC